MKEGEFAWGVCAGMRICGCACATTTVGTVATVVNTCSIITLQLVIFATPTPLLGPLILQVYEMFSHIFT